MYDRIRILRRVSILSFLFANIFMGIFFNHFISNIPTLVYVIMFIVSLIILKTDYVIWEFGLLKFESKNENFEQKDEKSKSIRRSLSLLLEIMTIRNFFVIFKQFFFNTLYELFPVCIVWISLLGLLFLANLLDVYPSDSFYKFITVFGILLGVFQFYLQRQEEKIASKIGINANRIGFIINEETNFEKFYNSLPEKPFDRNCLRSWISRNTDPKLQILDSFQFLAENNNAVDVISRIIRKSKSKTPILFNLTYPDSNKKFDLIETAVEANVKKKEQLMEAYNQFFNGEETFNTITDRIHEEIDIEEFGILALSNVNIFPEVLPQLTNSQLRNFVDKITDIEKERIKEPVYFESSNKFRENLHLRIMDEFFSKILF